MNGHTRAWHANRLLAGAAAVLVLMQLTGCGLSEYPMFPAWARNDSSTGFIVEVTWEWGHRVSSFLPSGARGALASITGETGTATLYDTNCTKLATVVLTGPHQVLFIDTQGSASAQPFEVYEESLTMPGRTGLQAGNACSWS